MTLEIVILAAGKGTRMHSSRPKVLHFLAGMPMLQHVIQTALQLEPAKVHVIIGHECDLIKKTLAFLPVHWIMQTEQLGTGHAVQQALPFIAEHSRVLVLSGDVPCIQVETLHKLVQTSGDLNLIVATLPNPTGLGRIVRNSSHQIIAIVEEKDADAATRQIKEIYSGICCAAVGLLQRWLPKITTENAQKEYYLTNIIQIAVAEEQPIGSIEVNDVMEIQGVNDRLQLQTIERYYQQKLAQHWLLKGVSIADSARIDIRGYLTAEIDVFIDINVIIEGNVYLSQGSHIGAHCSLKNVTIGRNAIIHPFSLLEDCVIGEHSEVGPFARLRPKTVLAAHCKIGNFVETKKASFGEGSKASHLSYLGDVTIGRQVNIGAGTITCNYDGQEKHHTKIEDGAFIGSDTQLVAPVTVGREATIGAGTTLRKDAPPYALTLTTSVQKTIRAWVRPDQRVKK
jgi:bifunctional UDP-N-acetylglucosamine pyrophosphorylase/glucosamine-1-phosphate N-acetyltransferase